MKRNFLKPLLAAALMLQSSGMALAATAIGEDWVGNIYYWFYDDGHAVVHADSYRGPDYSGQVVIPATITYNGVTYNVTEIGDYVFRDCENLTDISLPEGLKKIGESQFLGCDNLKSITIPSTVTEIGFDAFNDNSNYFGDPAIETITFADGTEPLTGYYEMSNGTPQYVAIQLGENVKTVYLGRNAPISRGENVENVTISGTVTELEGTSGLFAGSTAWKTLTIEYGNAPLTLGRTAEGKGIFTIHPIETLSLNRQLDYDNTDGITPFAGSQTLHSVTIGDNVTSIDEGLFNGCSGMQSLVVGSSVGSIGNNAFLGCTGLQRVDIKDLSAWCRYDFSSEEQNPLYYAKNLYIDGNLVTDLTLPSDIETVGGYTFYGYDKIASLTVPANVRTIETGAFGECTALKTLTIEDGEPLSLAAENGDRPFDNAPIETLYLGRSIDKQNFSEDLASLKKLTVGNNVTEFKEKYFENSKGLQEVHIADLGAWCRINFEDSISNPLAIAHKLYMDGSLMTDLAIPSGISAVKPYAFYGGECFTSLSLHSGISEIGEYAFFDCSGVPSLDLPAGVTVLNWHVFDGCSGLESITIPATVNSVYSSAFANCGGIKQVTIEDSQEELTVKLYGHSPDYDAGDLFENSPVGKMYVGRNITLESEFGIAVGFYLNSLTVGSMVTRMGDIYKRGYSYYRPDLQTPILTELIIEDSDLPLLVSAGAFSDISAGDDATQHSLYLGRNIEKETEFESSPFCNKLNEVELGANVTEIVPYMFDGCYDVYNKEYGLEHVAIDGNITNIGEAAFQGCGKLASFDVPENVATIGDNAFKDCTGLTYFDIPAGVAAIGASAFEGCTGLTSFRFESGSEISSISARTFYGCTGLLSVSLPESVTTIGESAFYGCAGLLSMNLPENVTTIGKSAFYDCSSLSVLSFGDSLESIGESAFYNCSALTDLHLPQTVTNVGNMAFSNCLSLRTVKVDNPVPPVAYANTFSVDTYLNATLSVPSGSIEAYNFAECWYNFRNKEDFPFSSIETVGNDTMKLYFNGSNLIVDGAGEDSLIEVYNIGGQCIYSGYDATIESLAHGVYLVRVAGRTFKVVL